MQPQALSTEDEELLNHCLSTAKVSVINRQGSHSSESGRAKRRVKVVSKNSEAAENCVIADTASASNRNAMPQPGSERDEVENELINSLLGVANTKQSAAEQEKDNHMQRMRFVLFVFSGILVRLSFMCSFGLEYVQVMIYFVILYCIC